MTRRMFHMKREHNEMRSPAPLAGIEGAERVGAGRRTAVRRQKLPLTWRKAREQDAKSARRRDVAAQRSDDACEDGKRTGCRAACGQKRGVAVY